MAVALNSYVHTTWLIYFGVMGHLWSQNDIITSWLRLPSTSITASHINMNIYKVFEHFHMLSMGIWQQPQTVIPTLLGSDFGVLGHLWSQNDVVTS
jgi:hypothetical protein